MVHETYDDPIYNLKAVVERTGVTADALRAWERRYGLPKPSRTEAGHRIYSQRDIDVIKWLVARQEEGLRIGRAVKLWRSLQGDGQDPLQSMPFPSEVTGGREQMAGKTVEDLREAWISSCLAFDESAAAQVLTNSFAMYPPEMVCSQIIGSGIDEIGQGWYEGEVTPQQEHFATQLAMRHLEALMAASPRPTRRGRILLACPPGEEHTLGLLTFGLLLRRAGWDVVYLGANVPSDRIEATIDAAEPDLVVLAAQQLHTAAALLDMAQQVQDRDLPLAFGGHIFGQDPRLQRHIPAHYLGGSLNDGLREVERLMTTARPTLDVEAPPPPMREAHSHYLDRRMALEAEMWQAMQSATDDYQAVRNLNEVIGRAVDAALRFGDLGLLQGFLHWLRGLDYYYGPPIELLDPYLAVYYRAAREHLDERGAPLVEWLRERVGDEAESGAKSA